MNDIYESPQSSETTTENCNIAQNHNKPATYFFQKNELDSMFP